MPLNISNYHEESRYDSSALSAMQAFGAKNPSGAPHRYRLFSEQVLSNQDIEPSDNAVLEMKRGLGGWVNSLPMNPIQPVVFRPIEDTLINEVCRVAALNFKTAYPTVKLDPCFPYYRDAHWIEGANYIALGGPANDYETSILYDDLFFQTMTGKPKITTMIGLGNCQSFHPIDNDFMNYSLDDRTASLKSAVPHKSYSVACKRFQHAVKLTTHNDSSTYRDSNGTQGLVSSTLEISDQKGIQKEVHAHLIGVRDCHSIDLSRNNHDTELLKEFLWQISIKSLTEGIAIHCHAGHGRTGHLILTLHLLKNYHKFFSSNDVICVTTNIINELHNIRKMRPQLVAHDWQLSDAIMNAHILYSYAYAKQYLPNQKEINPTPFELSSARATPAFNRR